MTMSDQVDGQAASRQFSATRYCALSALILRCNTTTVRTTSRGFSSTRSLSRCPDRISRTMQPKYFISSSNSLGGQRAASRASRRQRMWGQTGGAHPSCGNRPSQYERDLRVNSDSESTANDRDFLNFEVDHKMCRVFGVRFYCFWNHNEY